MLQTVTETKDAARLEVISIGIAVVALLLILHLGLLTALLAGLLIYQIVQILVPLFQNIGVHHTVGKTIALSVPVMVIGAAFAFAVIQFIDLLTGGFEGVVVLLGRM